MTTEMSEEQHPNFKSAEASPVPAKSTIDHEAEIAALRSVYEAQLVAANMRTEAVRAGMIDLDGLKLADTSSISLATDGTAVGSREVIEGLKRSKPWLFGQPSSSSSLASVPPPQAPRLRSAMEMTDEEYAAARAALVARR